MPNLLIHVIQKIEPYMKLLCSGSTRWVLLIGLFAFKIPSLHSWKNFLYGLLANMQEVEFSKCRDMKDKLCPVKFYLPLGFLVVMPRVKILAKNELSKEALEKFCTEDNFIIPAELKHSSFGYFKDKLVAVDYG
jgi:hypothetical protein